MNKRLVVVGGLIVASVAIGLFFKPQPPGWTPKTADGGSGLVLSVDPAQASARPARLEIRCQGGETELRLYVPIRALPPTGPSPGRLTLDLSERFSVGDAKIPVADQGGEGTVAWVVAPEGGFARRDDAAAFLARMANADWLDLGSVGFSGDSLAAATLTFAVKGLGAYRERMAVCGSGAT